MNVDIAAPVLISNHIWVKTFTVISGKSHRFYDVKCTQGSRLKSHLYIFSFSRGN